MPRNKSFATQEQLSRLADFMHGKPKFSCSSKARYSYGYLERHRLWSELTEELNNVKGAPRKTVEQWKTVWMVLKRRCTEKDLKSGTDDSLLQEEPVSELEERVLSIIRRDYLNSLRSTESPEKVCDNTPVQATKPSQQQLSHLVDFMYDRPKFSCTSSAQYYYGKIERERLWGELADKLNSIEGGAVKTVDQWKWIWKDLKRRCKLKREKPCQMATNGDSCLHPEPISKTEERLIAITERDDNNLLKHNPSPKIYCDHVEEEPSAQTPTTSTNSSTLLQVPTKRTFVSQEQLSHMVDFMYDRPKLSCSDKARYSYSQIERETLWSELVGVLNTIEGSVKNFDQWKLVWNGLKMRCRDKALKRNLQAETGGSLLHQEPLSKLEERVLNIMHRDQLNLERKKASPAKTFDNKQDEFCVKTPAAIKRASQEQLSYLADFMYDKPKLSCFSKNRMSYGQIERDRLWSELAEKLNSIECGPIKTVDQWKSVWQDLKNRCRKKRKKSNQMEINGGSLLHPESISKLDERVMAVIHRDHINMLQDKQSPKTDHDQVEEETYSQTPSTSTTNTCNRAKGKKSYTSQKPTKRTCASPEQFSHLVDFMFDEPKFSCISSAGHAYGQIERDRVWSELAEKLNSIEGGAVKTVEQWKWVWNGLRMRCRDNALKKNLPAETGDDDSSLHQQPVSKLEERVLTIMRRDHVNSLRDENMPERPLDNTENAFDFETPALEKRIFVSQAQYSHLAKFMYDKPRLNCNNQSRNAYGKTEYDKLWSQLVEDLNSIEGGSVKTVLQWKAVWRQLKTRCKARLQQMKTSHEATNGDNSLHQEPITELEEQVIAIIQGDCIKAYVQRNKRKRKRVEVAPTSLDIPEKQMHTEDNGRLAEHNALLEITNKTNDALKTLRQSTSASAEVESTEAAALRILDECNAANIQLMANMSESIKLMNEGLKANDEALNNLQIAIDHMPLLMCNY